MKGRVIIYSITGCPFCIRAKTKLKEELGLEYVDVNFDVYPHLKEDVQKRIGRKTVPQIFFNERHIGGFSELDSMVRETLQKCPDFSCVATINRPCCNHYAYKYKPMYELVYLNCIRR